eukprot:7260999-Ditylum_brightwellii.AAC.1
MKWTEFYESNTGYMEPAGVKCDNAGKSKLLEKRCNNAGWKFNINLEYTARDTPQQNSLAEVNFVIISNHSRAMMIATNSINALRYDLFVKHSPVLHNWIDLWPLSLMGPK